MEEIPEDSVFTTHKVARIFGVNPGTVVRWIRDGHIKAYRTIGGHFRIPRDDLVKFFNECGRISPARAEKTLSILVIDDDPTVFELLNRDLTTRFAGRVSIQWARDGFEGGRKVSELSPDLVFLDLMMPGINGFEVCRMIRNEKKTEKIEIVALTGYFSRENEDRILDAGAELCIAKPIDLALIRGFVERRLMGYSDTTEFREEPGEK